MKFSIKDFFSKCDQIHSFLRIWSHLRKKSLMENFIFCAVLETVRLTEADFPEKFLLAVKWAKWAQNRIFLSFFNILSLHFSKSNLTFF